MSVEQKKSVVREFFAEVWNKGNLDHIDELYTDDFRLNALWQNTALGGDGTADKAVIGRWLAGFPDMHVTVEQQVAEGDFVVSRHVATGTHAQPFMGIPGTGERGSTTGITITRVTDDVKVAEVWTCWDAVGMLMQLGVSPPPPSDGEPEDADAAWAAHEHVPEGAADAEASKQLVQHFYRELWSEGRLDPRPPAST